MTYMTAKDLIKNFFIKSGGLYISSKGTRVYHHGTIVYNSGEEGMNISFSSIDFDRKYIINNLNKIIALKIITNCDCYDYFFPLPPPK